MGTVSFREMPMVVKVATGVAFFTAWMCLEEFVINRSGFWRYMPYYKKDDACVWDLAVGGYWYSDAWLYTGINGAAVRHC